MKSLKGGGAKGINKYEDRCVDKGWKLRSKEYGVRDRYGAERGGKNISTITR